MLSNIAQPLPGAPATAGRWRRTDLCLTVTHRRRAALRRNGAVAARCLSIVYEDNHLLVAVKPPNMLTQGDAHRRH